ncbi:MAG: aggregation factor core [Paracoccaceae bacterium]
MFHPILFATAIGLFFVGPLHADLQVRFIEGAPKDRFVLKNVGACDIRDTTVSIDLSTSAGQLIFDVSEAGAGVEVFQPLELVGGANALRESPVVVDGQNAIDLEIKSLASGEKLAFTIDVDDTVGQREITVSGSEMLGAIVSLTSAVESNTAVFSTDAKANVTMAGC